MPVFSSPICDRPIQLFPQHGFQKKSFITNIPFLVSFFIGILSALLWMFLILGMDNPISVLGNYFWMPFANILGKINCITSEKSIIRCLQLHMLMKLLFTPCTKGLMLACYVDRDAINLLRDAKQIENVKYPFKEI